MQDTKNWTGNRVARGQEKYGTKQNGWKRASALKEGDIITDEDGENAIKVTSVDRQSDGSVSFKAGGQTYNYDNGEQVYVK